MVNDALIRSANFVSWMAASVRHAAGRLRAYWTTRSLAQQFAAAAAAVLIAGMLTIGSWVSDRIKQGIMHNSAASGALLMDSYLAPLVQELATGPEISAENRKALDDLLEYPAIDKRVSAIKIWRPDGTIAYSNWHDKIGQKFRPTPNFLRALSGAISAEFEGQYHEQDHQERSLATPLIEIYAPVRERNTDRIIAISEFYESGAGVKSELVRAEALTWLVVAGITALMIAALAGIVARGSRTIEEQRDTLEAQVGELRTLLARNAELSSRVQKASRRTAIVNEKLLRRVGADLHDGPAQLLSLALLRLDALQPSSGGAERRAEAAAEAAVAGPDASLAAMPGEPPGAAAGVRHDIEMIRRSLNDAMREIRAISSGLALPELGRASLDRVVQMAVRAHERKTETRVATDIDALARPVPDELKTCVYRFVQEGLNNAFHHAAGMGQRVALKVSAADRITISVEDDGPGLEGNAVPRGSSGLGLPGMRDRIESLGGTMRLSAGSGGGTCLTARFDLGRLKIGDDSDD